jgi:hypothetical protein
VGKRPDHQSFFQLATRRLGSLPTDFRSVIWTLVLRRTPAASGVRSVAFRAMRPEGGQFYRRDGFMSSACTRWRRDSFTYENIYQSNGLEQFNLIIEVLKARVPDDGLMPTLNAFLASDRFKDYPMSRMTTLVWAAIGRSSRFTNTTGLVASAIKRRESRNDSAGSGHT